MKTSLATRPTRNKDARMFSTVEFTGSVMTRSSPHSCTDTHSKLPPHSCIDTPPRYHSYCDGRGVAAIFSEETPIAKRNSRYEKLIMVGVYSWMWWDEREGMVRYSPKHCEVNELESVQVHNCTHGAKTSRYET